MSGITEKRSAGYANRRCQECNELFQGTHRAMFCSPACRMRKYRKGRPKASPWFERARAANDLLREAGSEMAGSKTDEQRKEALIKLRHAITMMDEVLGSIRSP